MSQNKREEKGVKWEDDIPIELIMLSASEEYAMHDDKMELKYISGNVYFYRKLNKYGTHGHNKRYYDM